MLDKRPAFVISVLIVMAVVGALIAFTDIGRRQSVAVGQDVKELGQNAKAGINDAADQTKKAAEGVKNGIQNAVH